MEITTYTKRKTLYFGLAPFITSQNKGIRKKLNMTKTPEEWREGLREKFAVNIINPIVRSNTRIETLEDYIAANFISRKELVRLVEDMKDIVDNSGKRKVSKNWIATFFSRLKEYEY